jgi:hypothetical protein
VVLSALAWFGWLAWDHEYQIDPATGIGQGPYEAWQVFGCVLTLLVAAVVAGLAHRPAVAALWVMLPFTVCWTVDAARTDETGLFAVGTLLIAGGLYLGAWGVAGVSGAAVRAVGRRA